MIYVDIPVSRPHELLDCAPFRVSPDSLRTSPNFILIPPQQMRRQIFEEPKEYVVGFMFSHDGRHVALIRKTKPKWQAGKLNGIGGKIEAFDESPADAMAREFAEEAGVGTQPNSWHPFALMTGGDCPYGGYDWRVHCFARFGYLHALVSLTEEQVEIVATDDICARGEGAGMLGNLPWLVAMALDHLSNPQGPKFAEIRYYGNDNS